MPLILIKFLRPLAPYLAGIGLLFSAYFYVSMLRHDVSALNEKNTALVAQNVENLAAISAYKQQEARWSAAEAALTTQTIDTGKATGDIFAKIRIAPMTADAPVAPVLAQALDGLRALQGDAP